ncbi:MULTISPECIES: conjugal transfer protein TraH [unclassified Ensifer]|uniref:conjugal transfer protein TraH n=1 Tax=unclassified Ensifer TaxID=2633371 RepID=UPI00070C6F05|nr:MULTISPECIES: conjugal transfer protein TraH [unclassified Ensifer]KRD63357.1 conjugal transfer protein TraH [Ensifer sp. Root278]MBV7521439.1 conjugal transfer protein TraH [Ensifer sp. ENS12]
MLEALLIEKCADPSLEANVVDAFVNAVGDGDPLAVTVKVGRKTILVEKAATPDEALAIARRYVGQATVRVGVTSYPAHLGIESGMELSPALFDACENLRMGTAMFAKVMRIVAAWYGSNASKEALPYVLSDSLNAWVSGEFEGKDVFRAQDPGGRMFLQGVTAEGQSSTDEAPLPVRGEVEADDVTSAGMRVDISRTGVNAAGEPVR